MRQGNHLISTKLAVLLIFGIVGGLMLVRGGLTTEAQLTPTPSMHVDIGSSFIPTSTGNTFTQDPDSSGSGAGNGFSDQIMTVPQPLTACVSKTVSNFASILQVRVITDIILENADELAGADVRINYDPSQIAFVLATITPFPGAIGLINLPEEAGVHRTASPAFSFDNTNGAAFLAGTYQGFREFDVSSESGPTVDGAVNSLPNRNAGQAPDGGVFVRISWNLQAGSNGQDVRIDLTVGGPTFTGGGVIASPSGFTNLTSQDPGGTIQALKLSNADLFDGVISVNKASPSPCPGPEPAHDAEVKHIGGTGASVLKLFKNCNSDPCTETQNHQLNVINNSDHEEDIRVDYKIVGWPATCSVNAQSGSPITVSNTVETGVNENASRNVTVPLTFSCPASEAGALTGTPITFRLEAVHQRAGADSQPDDDAANDILTKSKVLE